MIDPVAYPVRPGPCGDPRQRRWDADDALAGAISTIGTQQFGQALMAVSRQWFDAVQLVAFRFRGSSACSTVIAENMAGDRKEVRALADSYRMLFLGDDPNRDVIGGRAGRTESILCRTICADHISAPAYREMLFERPRLASKISLLARRGPDTLYLNFYRSTSQASFGAGDVDRLAGASATLLALVDRHLLLQPGRPGERPTDEDLMRRIAQDRGVALSAREHRLCTLLLNGLSVRAAAERIGVSVNSAVSYRRRAFLKLDIEKQKDLFALAIGAAGH